MDHQHHLAFFLRRNKHGHSSGKAWVAFVRICHRITWSSGSGSGLATACQQEQWSSFTSMMETPPPEATLKAPSDSKFKKILMAMLLSIVSSWILDNTLYNQLFAVWKGSQVSRWSTHNQKPRPCSWCFLLKIDQNMKLEKWEMRVFPRVTENREHKRNR